MAEEAVKGLENVEKLVGEFGQNGFSVCVTLSLSLPLFLLSFLSYSLHL